MTDAFSLVRRLDAMAPAERRRMAVDPVSGCKARSHPGDVICTLEGGAVKALGPDADARVTAVWRGRDGRDSDVTVQLRDDAGGFEGPVTFRRDGEGRYGFEVCPDWTPRRVEAVRRTVALFGRHFPGGARAVDSTREFPWVADRPAALAAVRAALDALDA